MNKFYTTLVAGLLFATPTFALDDYEEHNITVSKGNLSLTARDYDGLDKWMGEVTYKLNGHGLGYRYQESKGDVEHRLRYTGKTLLKVWNISVSPRVEWREFDKESKDDFGNIWIRVAYKQPITEQLSAYFKFQPKFAFANDKFDDGEYYTSQNQIGVDYKVTQNVTFGIFGEKNYDKDWETDSIFLGTNLAVKF
jgi:hypothetical protein